MILCLPFGITKSHPILFCIVLFVLGHYKIHSGYDPDRTKVHNSFIQMLQKITRYMTLLNFQRYRRTIFSENVRNVVQSKSDNQNDPSFDELQQPHTQLTISNRLFSVKVNLCLHWLNDKMNGTWQVKTGLANCCYIELFKKCNVEVSWKEPF